MLLHCNASEMQLNAALIQPIWNCTQCMHSLLNASIQFSARQRDLLRKQEVECTSDVVMVSRYGAAVHGL